MRLGAALFLLAVGPEVCSLADIATDEGFAAYDLLRLIYSASPSRVQPCRSFTAYTTAYVTVAHTPP